MSLDAIVFVAFLACMFNFIMAWAIPSITYFTDEEKLILKLGSKPTPRMKTIFLLQFLFFILGLANLLVVISEWV